MPIIQPVIFTIPGYVSYIKSRPHRSNGGVAIYIDENTAFVARSDLENFSCDTYECAFINVNLNCKGKPITMGVVYRPPNNDAVEFNSSFNNLLSKLLTEKRKCFIAGDFNMNLLNYNTHNDTDLLYKQ